MSSTPLDLPSRIRADFPILETDVDGNRLVYLDSAATSLTPRQVLKEMERYYTEVGANIHRGTHYLSECASDDYERVRLKIAQFTGFRGNEVVFVPNTTMAMNLLAQGLPLRDAATVLVPFDAHHSALLPWRRKARVRCIPVDPGGVVMLDRYADLLRDRPDVVVLNHCSNVSGVYAPLERMARMAKEAGAITVVDAAQSIGHRRVHCPDVDFLTFSAHKMLGPTGVGVLCGRSEYLETVEPAALGGGTVDWVDMKQHVTRKLPHRLEAGTPDIAGVYGLGAAVDYLLAIGHDRLEAHDREMGAALASALSRQVGLRMLGPEPETADRGGILSFAIVGVHSMKEIAKILSDAHGVMCRTGHMCAQPFVDAFTDDEVLRVSTYLYNGQDDLAVFCAALEETLKAVGAGR
ncbi:aminotransferase class V-fold PLP-dependent enzyme [Spongiactinospora sp. 9N601]|uniref:aminotransferase class V-fold PLP-dependent enzyme n=1 Tax=Spongiactinospora sp. 9N601 TaxID=3375149 RepID=UPI0037BE183F